MMLLLRRCDPYCADYHCLHSVGIDGDRWTDEFRLSDLEPRFACTACGRRGGDIRPNWDEGKRSLRLLTWWRRSQ